MPFSSPTVLNYEELLLLSEQMLDAAQAGNWTAFAESQQVYMAVVEKLRAIERDVPRSGEERNRRHALLEQILHYDARIRDVMAPQLANLSRMLGDSRRRMNLSNSYGALA